MDLKEIRVKIDAVDDQLLKLFLERMHLAEEVAAYKQANNLPILNKERERAVLAKVTEAAGDKERYAYHLYSTLFELARSRQAELISVPTKVAAQIKTAQAAGSASRNASPRAGWAWPLDLRTVLQLLRRRDCPFPVSLKQMTQQAGTTENAKTVLQNFILESLPSFVEL